MEAPEQDPTEKMSITVIARQIPTMAPTPSQHRQDRNKTALPEIIVRTESVFPLPFNNKANPLSQLTISNEILGGMGNQISLFTKYPPSTTDQPPKLPKHPAHIHNPLNCYQTWREEEALPPPPKVGRKTQKDECTKIGQCRVLGWFTG
ncbi:hypothetical protein BLNAU_19450 [Blattamonas nauphoetae]|uniref:Uncharacterized protein n=1 Tax=Blattamonas nauphoetae TaxID=2049346 RepID=A0ABQ9X1K0_9EUKA|nr:hypothetical protein BLNAU_19450 [Blattamonas nauphoetae]